jgi:hypothetical protein
LGHQQAREHSLAKTIFSSNRYDFFGLNRLDGRWQLERPGTGVTSRQRHVNSTLLTIFGVEFDFFAFHGLNSAL